jgi:hypothetical protein
MRSSRDAAGAALIAEEALLEPLRIIEPVDADDHAAPVRALPHPEWAQRAAVDGLPRRNSSASMPIGQAIAMTERPPT